MTRRRLLGALSVAVLAAAAAAALGVTFGAFSATTSNGPNSFSAAASFGPQVATGTYTGNATNNRAISAGFQPDYVLVKADAAQPAVATTSSATAGYSKPTVGAVAPTTGLITALTATGFTVGTDARVNASGTTYHWLAVKSLAGSVKVGSYAGNGTSASITGVGFSPDYVFVAGSGSTRAVQRFNGSARSYQYDADTGSTSRITAFGTDGFSVGNSADANAKGATYFYLAVKSTAGSVTVSSYAGNGTSGRSVTGVGFQPQALVVRADDTATGREGHLGTATTVPKSLFFDTTTSTSNGVQAFQPSGFQLGTDSSVNASGPTYYYLAFR